jgi:hypothetical protein
MINASGVEVKLSWAQQRAYDSLTDEWQSSYKLQERMSTLDILVSKGVADSRKPLGTMFFPRTMVEYRRKEV